MKVLHPDKHTLKPREEQESVARSTSNVTRGYEVLKNDYQRALHLLELKGNAMEDDVSGSILGHDFLMEIMEIRETIDSINMTDNTNDDLEELQKLLAENKERIAATCHELAIAFGKDDLDEAKRLAAKLQYWNRIEETITAKI